MWDLISNYVGTLVSIVGAMIFVRSILHKKVVANKFFVVILMLLVPVIICMMYHFNYSYLKTIVSCLLCMFLFKYSFKLDLHDSFLYSIVFIILLTISEIFLFLIIMKILIVNNSYIYDSLSGSLICNCCITLFFLLLSYIFKDLLNKLLNVKIKHTFLFYILLLFICVIFFFYVTFSNIGNGIGLVSGVAVIIILLIVVINLLVQAYRNNELIIKYDKLLEFIKKYEVEIDNQRTMRHEIKNQLLTIKSKIIDKDKNQNIINYIDEILEDNSKVINHVEYAKLNYLPPNGIKGLFYFKVNEAIDRDIKVSINISKEIENSLLTDLNANTFNQVGKLLGILLDNAIESAEIAFEKEIGIEVYVLNNMVNFIISNTYVGDIAARNGVFSRSTKGENRGHGLLLAKAIVGSNNRFELETTITDVLYVQKLIIK